MAIDLGEIERMKKMSEFGEKCIDMAKELGIIPKKERRKVVYRAKIVYRKPRGPNKPKVTAAVPMPTGEALQG